MGRRPVTVLAAGLALLAAGALVRAAVPPRFPAVDGTLSVRLVDAADPERDRRARPVDLGGRPGRSGTWLVVAAGWRPAEPVPAARAGCHWLLLPLGPPGAVEASPWAVPANRPEPAGTAAAGLPTHRTAAATRRVLRQYGEVLPGRLVRGLATGTGPAPLALPLGTRQAALGWRVTSSTPDPGLGTSVRVFLAPVCPDVVAGLVELGRPR